MKKINLTYIIDDDPIFIFGISKLMKIEGFCNGFLVFNNGQDAFDHLKPIIQNGGDEMPELILLDLNMPVMDGWQFLDEFIKIESKNQILIYIVSSSIDPKDLNKAKQYKDVNNYIIKPVKREHLKLIMQDI